MRTARLEGQKLLDHVSIVYQLESAVYNQKMSIEKVEKTAKE